MSKKPAAIPLFADAYLADTMHLTTEEHGAYLLLLMAAWRQDDCSLPDDDKKLARIAGLSTHRWNGMKGTIREFWTVEAGRIFNPRLRKERQYVEKVSQTKRENVQRRWDKQPTENKQPGSYDRNTVGHTPPPPPIEEPNGSSPPVSPHASKRGSRLPADWQPTLGAKTAAMVERWPDGMLTRELGKFRDHAADKGRVSKDWNAAFRTWLVNADEWSKQHGNQHQAHRGASARDSRDGFDRAIDRELANYGIGPDAAPDERSASSDGPDSQSSSGTVVPLQPRALR